MHIEQGKNQNTWRSAFVSRDALASCPVTNRYAYGANKTNIPFHTVLLFVLNNLPEKQKHAEDTGSLLHKYFEVNF